MDDDPVRARIEGRHQDPAVMRELLREVQHVSILYRQLAKMGQLQIVTPEHADPLIAATGKIYADLLTHPVAKRFIRRPPRAYMMDTPMPALEITADKYIVMSPTYPKAFTPEEMKVALAHEIGHAVRLDFNLRNKNSNPFDRVAVELEADDVALLLTRDIDSLRSMRKKTQEIVEGYFLENPGAREALTVKAIKLPTDDERMQHVEELARRTATPEGWAAFEKETLAKLEAVHKATFGHRHAYRNEAHTQR